ncbi:ATP-dependent DNA helicase [Anaerococcus sp. DFU013_CI05]|uniref:ATP-dependent DNA helicase n=1 Tax=unclassified Anaerococcus TaxID=2614126 RepID=UPI001933BD14|nr:ATP-dependent DNA helicase [Anaerococcus sp. mt242]MBM0045819.1 ATP-dependent DNA helicase [Anaerococcus sp. mt242]
MLVRISVRNLIEFVMRSGDIDNRFRDNARMIEGIRAHQAIQKKYGANYKSEYSLKNSTIIDDVEFIVEGRADGLLKEKDGFVIDEIKSTSRMLSEIDGTNKLHWAQAKCYAYFYALDNNLENMSITLTYVSVEDYSTIIFKESFSFDELKDFYYSLLNEYLNFSKILARNLSKRNQTIKELDFPYKEYRKGQRKMAVAVYKSILDEKKLFVDAPTGIGKTISTVFPSVKSMGEDLTDKIFYLTSKSTQANEALKSIYILKNQGLFIKALSITSKEKICLNDEVKCNPIDCPFARGHFDRVNDALKDIIDSEEIMDFSTITSYAEKHRVCPFELELDISSYADFIICDYNYVFNPNTYLKRFFDEVIDRYVFLIDESHNLVERARDMYGFSFNDERFKEISKKLDNKKQKNIIKYCDEIIDTFDQLYAKYGKKLYYYQENQIEDFDKKFIKLLKPLQKYLVEEHDDENYDELLNLFFDINKFLKIGEYYTKGFYSVISYDEDYDQIIFEIKCIDPSMVLSSTYKNARSVIFFSATLSPMIYFTKILGADDSLKLRLDMPFDEKNFALFNREISTRYRDRNNNLVFVSEAINEFINSKKGNYFIFFPSYSYLEDVYEDYKTRFDDEIVIQDRFMNEKDTKKFLKQFDKDSQKTAFVVLGGIFSEGVDLIGDRLIGSMIISVGMPGVSNERNLIKTHFDKLGENGFDYSYTFPGLNKVYQAAGRVIRSENDKGIIYLLDDRFNSYKYKSMYPKHWKNNGIKLVNEKSDFDIEAEKFWEDVGEKE